MKRNKNIDLIKGLALIFVILVHSLRYTGFYQREITGLNDIFYIFLRTIFVNCVPLFLLATGYLMNKHVPNKKYYKGITKVIITYIIISIIQTTIVNYDTLTLKLIINDIFNFTGAYYSWYVKMYIGLFLLIPYLNILYKNLKKPEKQGLIIILIIMSSLTAFKTTEIESFLPDWWNIYPLIYYFLGCYIKEYNNKNNNFKLLIAILLFNTLFNYIISCFGNFKVIMLNDYMSIFIIASSYFMFKILLNIKYKGNKIIEILSNHSLTIYLMSYIFDLYIYKNIAIMNITILELIIGSTIVLILSTIISLIIDKVIKIVLNKLHP